MAAGAPPPWGAIAEADRRITVSDIRETFSGRSGRPSAVERDAGVRASSVLAPFYESAGEVFVVLTRRASHLRSHQGEVSFPGGACEPGETLPDAALREAEEEIGLDPATVEVVGELDHLMTVSSRSFIVPHVGILAALPSLEPNPAEVDAVLHVPLRELLLDEVYREELWNWGLPLARRPIFFFELVGDTVWGATAAMLRQFLALTLGLDTAIDHH